MPRPDPRTRLRSPSVSIALTHLAFALLVILACVCPRRVELAREPGFNLAPPSRADVVIVIGRTINAVEPGGAPCVVTGRVWDCEDDTRPQPLSTALVYLMIDTDRHTATDSNGRYMLDSLPAGSVTLEASYIGFKPAQAELQLSPGDSAVVDFRMKYWCGGWK